MIDLFADDCVYYGASFSEDRVYRYSLTRVWGEGPVASFIGLNPSTADETVDDPTVRRCMGFARSWGCGGIVMLNIFALRATDPKVMKAHPAPVGTMNDQALRFWTHTKFVVPCWGVHGVHLRRGQVVRELLALKKLSVFGLTKEGHPKHPLYLSRSQQLVEWR